ncbi:hypothetical protein [Zhihengliuella halotolerans]|uniref:hypothetical protein n=1 Tax=Zhihengliuella halotolerans TaxID=370736 RepID=UPI000C81001E|nr:hypothetical protein [Zhihengliuella halotolerans]
MAARKTTAKPASGLAKFVNPEAAAADETVPEPEAKATAPATGEGQPAEAKVDATAAQESTPEQAAQEEPATAGTAEGAPAAEAVPAEAEAEPKPDDVEVTVIADAITLRPGWLASKGQKVTLPRAKVDRLVKLGAVRR